MIGETMAWLEIRLDTTPEAIDWVCTLLATELDPQNIQITNYLPPDPESGLEPNPESWDFTMLLYILHDDGSRTRLDHLEQILSPLYRTGLTGEMQVSIVPTKPQLFSHFQQPVGNKFLVSVGTTPSKQLQVSNQQLSKLSEKQPSSQSPVTQFLDQSLESPSPASQFITLYLNPSLAFGSGLHPATIVSLQMLERYVLPGMRVLDLGSGSGILSVASAKLGAQVLALDNDLIAVRATQGAIELNQVQSQVIAQVGSLGEGNNLGHWLGETVGEVAQVEGQGDLLNPAKARLQSGAEVGLLSGAEVKFDLIMANIFARIHCALAPDYYQALSQNQQDPQKQATNISDPESQYFPQQAGRGLLIMAGFTTDQEEDVRVACQQVGFEFLDRLGQNQGENEWVALVYRC
jgi:ribosomal protein L11 methyltransferase